MLLHRSKLLASNSLSRKSCHELRNTRHQFGFWRHIYDHCNYAQFLQYGVREQEHLPGLCFRRIRTWVRPPLCLEICTDLYNIILILK